MPNARCSSPKRRWGADTGRRLGLVVLVLLIGVAVWTALGSDALPAERTRLVLHENLLRGFGRAELFRETTRLALGSERGQRHTVEADRRRPLTTHGVLSRPAGEPPFVWLVGTRPDLRVDVIEPRDRTLTLFLANGLVGETPAERAQAVTVLFNGQVLGRAELPADDRSHAVAYPVPASMQHRGPNRVQLIFDRAHLRTLQDERPLPIAAVATRLHFDVDGEEPPPSGPPSRAGVMPVLRGEAAPPMLVLPGGTAARLGHVLPDVERLVLRMHVHLATVPFEVTLQTDHLPRRVLFHGAPGESLPERFDHDLSPLAGQPALIEVWALEGEGQLQIDVINLLVEDTEGGGPDAAGATGAPAGPRRLAARERPSFLLVVLDALARDRTSAFGNERDTTPRLAALAGGGLTAPDASAPASYTLASTGTLLTGVEPHHHGVMLLPSETRAPVVVKGTPHLAVELRDRGWRTAAFVTNPNAGSRFGYAEGFTLWEDLYAQPALWDEGVSGAELPPRLADFLSAVGEDPFLAYVHVFEPHAPYEAPGDLAAIFVGPYDGPVRGDREWIDGFKQHGGEVDEDGWRHLAELYDARIGVADRVLGELLDVLERSGRAADTYVLVTSDHGEALGERGRVEHGDDVHVEQIAVPLVLAGPGIGPGVIDGPATLSDVAPTLLGLAGLAAPAGTDGLDLLVGAGPPANRRLLSRSYALEPALRWRMGDLELIVDVATRQRSLYDLASDPGQTRDIASGRPAATAALYRELCEALAGAVDGAASGAVVMDPEELERMAQIGYVDSGEDAERELAEALVMLQRRL